MTTIDIGRWRCGCGFFLDLTSRPDSDVLVCHCRKCERTYQVRVTVMELVRAQTAEAA